MALQRVETDAIQDDAVTTAKIAPNAVAAADIAADAITNVKVAAGAAIAVAKISGLGTAATLTAGTAANNVVQLDGSARLPAVSGANLTGVSTDTSAMENNIAILAFKTQSGNNLAKFNLVDQVIDEYKDATGVTFSTAGLAGGTAIDGYVGTSTFSGPATAYATGDRQSTITVTMSGITTGNGTPSNLVDGGDGSAGQRTSATWSWIPTAHTPSAGAYIRFQFSSATKLVESRWESDIYATQATFQWQRSNDASSWTNIGSSFVLGAGGAGPAGFVVATETNLSLNDQGYTYYQLLYVSGAMTAAAWIEEMEFKQSIGTLTTNAAGTVTSVANTALTAPTTGDICMLIENVSATATLNTSGNDLRCAISRNGGTGWDYVTLVDKGTWGSGTKKILVANNVAFSNSASGTDMRYKLEFANQSSGSREVRVHATSLAWA